MLTPRLKRANYAADEPGAVNTPLLKTPEPKRGILLKTEGTLYFADLQMVTPKHKSRVPKTP